ncbi:thioredoxin domain-containing protein [Candidatus Nomurabacteria bacterium]|nr:thioredoxin domain-containing protein [Candidatus Nomurabacteria bacterium]
MENQEKKRSIGTGEAIILAGLLVAIAIFVTNSGGGTNTQNSDDGIKIQNPSPQVVDAESLIRGETKDTQVYIVEYSDYDCPFCARFHPTMKSIVEKYDGKVAWVYKQFPLTSRHPNAYQKSVAALCVNKIGGEEKFWQYTDLLFETPRQNSELATLAGSLGIDTSAFDECMNSPEVQSLVDADIAEAQSLGATGTPFAVAVKKDGTNEIIRGAVPQEEVEKIINTLLN